MSSVSSGVGVGGAGVIGVDGRLTAIVFRQPWRRLSFVSMALSSSVGGVATVSRASCLSGGSSFGLLPIFFRQPLLSTIALVSPEPVLSLTFAAVLSLRFGLLVVCCRDCRARRSVEDEYKYPMSMASGDVVRWFPEVRSRFPTNEKAEGTQINPFSPPAFTSTVPGHREDIASRCPSSFSIGIWQLST